MDEFSHTFVVCAYKESPFLRDCLVSLTQQTLPARILMATSTPNDAIRSLAEEFGVPLFISDKPSGIGLDFVTAHIFRHDDVSSLDIHRTDHMLSCRYDEYHIVVRIGSIRQIKMFAIQSPEKQRAFLKNGRF